MIDFRTTRREFLRQSSLAALTGATIPAAFGGQEANAAFVVDDWPAVNDKAMFNRFTDRARSVVRLAAEECVRLKHGYVGTEHILLGLVKEGSGVAAYVLKNLNVDLHKIRCEVEKIVQPGFQVETTDTLPQTPRAKNVLEYSMEEARGLNHNYVGTEHLLLGLLREQDGIGAWVLVHLGLKLESVREEALNLLGHGCA